MNSVKKLLAATVAFALLMCALPLAVSASSQTIDTISITINNSCYGKTQADYADIFFLGEGLEFDTPASTNFTAGSDECRCSLYIKEADGYEFKESYTIEDVQLANGQCTGITKYYDPDGQYNYVSLNIQFDVAKPLNAVNITMNYPLTDKTAGDAQSIYTINSANVTYGYGDNPGITFFRNNGVKYNASEKTDYRCASYIAYITATGDYGFDASAKLYINGKEYTKMYLCNDNKTICFYDNFAPYDYADLSLKVTYKQNVTLKVSAELPAGYTLSVNGKTAVSSGTETPTLVEIGLGQVDSSKDVKVKILDENGNQLSGLNGKTEKTIKVYCDNSLMGKISAFFSMLLHGFSWGEHTLSV